MLKTRLWLETIEKWRMEENGETENRRENNDTNDLNVLNDYNVL